MQYVAIKPPFCLTLNELGNVKHTFPIPIITSILFGLKQYYEIGEPILQVTKLGSPSVLAHRSCICLTGGELLAIWSNVVI
jgi:hypothetical protein